jgi:hypothetical protein
MKKINRDNTINKLDKYLVSEGESSFDYKDKALCATSDDPDLWFSEETDLNRKGKPTPLQNERNALRTIRALKICDKCEVKNECLKEGMRESNIDSGVWGGLMSGERIQLAGLSTIGHWRRNKVNFSRRIRHRIKVTTNE